MRKTLFVLCLAASVSGCGKASEDSFNKSFDDSFRKSCVSSAVNSGAPEAIAKQACECGLKAINEKYSPTEKMTLSNDKMQPIMAECVNKVRPSNG